MLVVVAVMVQVELDQVEPVVVDLMAQLEQIILVVAVLVVIIVKVVVLVDQELL
jgi:hypothetical protein